MRTSTAITPHGHFTSTIANRRRANHTDDLTTCATKFDFLRLDQQA